ncbi:LysR substrate-binding domain-containing protein [Orrella sp. JC864]|uniref:LysR substrate-binding domain-containing protein n=1 Tax=Orrella sp. JC864 TaxID=3120298 RepID=UPI0012BCE757
METRHLRYFLALAGSLNFTRAAERVHVTQSTLSHQIRQMEEALGQPLFERVGKRVLMTAAGQALLPYARRALQEIDQGLAELKQGRQALTGEVRIGATHTFNQDFIPQCVAGFLQQHPTVRVTIEELAADAIAQGLQGGTLDFGVAYRPETPGDLVFEPLLHEELMLAVGAHHPLARRRRLRMVELHREPLVLLPASFATRRMLDECFRAAGAEPLVVAEMNTVAAMAALALRAPIGAIVAPSAVRSQAGLKLVPLENPTPLRTPGLLFKASRERTRPAIAFAALLRRLAVPAIARRGARPGRAQTPR